MVFAMAFESDVAENHHFVVASNFLECALQIITRIFKVTGKPFFIGANDPSWGPQKSFSGWIIASPFYQSSNRVFGHRSRWTSSIVI